ncbi:hypothetical protein [Salinispora vitiensis]|uniref:hypothetical protein n=1 Tax=Salinispora vitiensis TaxID=999544 RepID=UPI0013A55685|nr:hypothetical protein [Salinispora vitiensis]
MTTARRPSPERATSSRPEDATRWPVERPQAQLSTQPCDRAWSTSDCRIVETCAAVNVGTRSISNSVTSNVNSRGDRTSHIPSSSPAWAVLHFETMERVGFPSDFIDRLPRGRRGVMVLDNAEEILRRTFGSVEEKPYVDSLRFDRSEQFMNFYGNGHRLLGVKAHAGDTISQSMIDDLYTAVEEAVAKQISNVGYFEISKQVSVFVCEK